MKTIRLLLIACLIPVWGFAQEASVAQDSVKEKIRDIKLSENYVYAEATTANGISEAQQNSLDLLRVHVASIFSERLGMEKEDVDEIWDVIEDKCQNVVVKKGDLFKVFTYVMKDLLFPGNIKKKIEKMEKEKEVRALSDSLAIVLNFDVAPDSVAVVAKDTVAVASKPAVQVKETVAVVAEVPKVESRAVAVASQPVVTVAVAPAAPVVVAKVAPVVKATPVAKAVEEKPAVEKPAAVDKTPSAVELLPEPDRAVVGEMLNMTTYDELITYLDKMKDDGRLVYGRIKTMSSPGQSYLIVIKKGALVTLLGKGQSERINLKTNKPDALKSYGGHSVIWFQLY